MSARYTFGELADMWGAGRYWEVIEAFEDIAASPDPEEARVWEEENPGENYLAMVKEILTTLRGDLLQYEAEAVAVMSRARRRIMPPV